MIVLNSVGVSCGVVGDSYGVGLLIGWNFYKQDAPMGQDVLFII